jgi:large subunit ribosomal protein L24
MKQIKLKIRTGDTVKVLSGKDKNKTGKVLRVFPTTGRVVVENINIHTKFEKSRKAGQPGTQVKVPGSMAVSKVMLVDSHSGKPSRVGYSFLEDGTKQRIAKQSGKAV